MARCYIDLSKIIMNDDYGTKLVEIAKLI